MGRLVKVHVSRSGGVAVQMEIGERPLSEAQMCMLQEVILRQGDAACCRQLLVNLETWEVRMVPREDEVGNGTETGL